MKAHQYVYVHISNYQCLTGVISQGSQYAQDRFGIGLRLFHIVSPYQIGNCLGNT